MISGGEASDPVEDDCREEVLVTHLDHPGVGGVLHSELVGDGLDQHTGMDEIVQGYLALPVHVEPADDGLGELRRQSVPHLNVGYRGIENV